MNEYCSDCKKFFHCKKNSEEWDEAKSLHPNSQALRLTYMRNVYNSCTEKV